jgi:queuine/archaeosine tRNA-ribosyltransferase
MGVGYPLDLVVCVALGVDMYVQLLMWTYSLHHKCPIEGLIAYIQHERHDLA